MHQARRIFSIQKKACLLFILHLADDESINGGNFASVVWLVKGGAFGIGVSPIMGNLEVSVAWRGCATGGACNESTAAISACCRYCCATMSCSCWCASVSADWSLRS